MNDATSRADKLLGRVASQAKRTLKSPDVDEVHDLRVAIRRFSQVLIVFKPFFPPKEVKRVRKALKKTMALAGEVRDLDVAADLVGESKLREASIFRAEFKCQRKESARFLAEKLHRWTARRVFSKWRHKLLPASAGEGVTIEDAAGRNLPRLVNRFFACGRSAVGATTQIAQLHQLRIAAKKVRYAIELFAPIPESIERIKKVQTILGDVHDLEVVRAKVFEQATGKKLAAELEKSRDQKIEEFKSYWTKEFAGAENLARWRKHLNVSRAARRVIARRIPSKPAARSESGTSAARPAKSA